MNKQIRFVLSCVALAFLAGCVGDHSSAAREGRSRLQSTTWFADSIQGTPVIFKDVQQRPHFTLSESDHRVAAHGGVNRFSGTYVLDMSYFTFGPLAGTKMAGPADMNAQEAEFIKALTATNGFKVQGNALTLLKDWEPVMTLHAEK